MNRKTNASFSMEVNGDNLHGGTVNFWTDDGQIFKAVSEYIETIIDAERYRRQAQEVTRGDKE